MRVSTITPCYNMEPYLKTFLDELPKQTIFDEIEVVLDHNEPSHEERRWVAEFQQKYPGRLKHIVVDPVEPIGTSMNRCIQESSAPNVCIWNVDDLRTPDSLEKQVRLLEETDHGIAFGNFVIVKSFGSVYGMYVDHAPYIIDRPWELTRGMILGPFPMWRKSLHKKVGYFDEQLKTGADFDLAVRLCANATVGMVQGVLGYYLDEGKGASTRGGWKQPVERSVIEQRYGILDKLDPQWVKNENIIKYDPTTIINFGQKCDVGTFFDDFETFKKENVR